MDNNERRTRIQELRDQLQPLLLDKARESLRYNFLKNPYMDSQRRDLTAQEREEVEQVGKRLEDLDKQIAPLFHELRSLQVRYEVEYDGEVWDQGMLISVPNKREFFLSTDCDIDTRAGWPDQTAEVWDVVNEVADYIYNQEYGRFAIRHIRKL